MSQIYVEFGFERCRQIARDGERRALRDARMSPLPTSEGLYQKAVHWLSALRASVGSALRHPYAAPAHSR